MSYIKIGGVSLPGFQQLQIGPMIVRVLAFLGLALVLSGCGKSSSSADGKSPDSRGVIATAADCVSFGPDAVTACATAIETAVTHHEASSASYPNIDVCEKTVGTGDCERSATGMYRQRLSAFMVTIGGASAHAEPLYPAKDGAVGFQYSDRSQVLASDRSIMFSRLALSVAETQATPGKKSSRKPIF